MDRWYAQYQAEGAEGLVEQRPTRRQFGDRIPEEVRRQVVESALDHPERSPRQLAWDFTDKQDHIYSRDRACFAF